MNDKLNREIHLRSRPEGLPVPDNFELVEVPLPEPVEGEVLVRNIYMSVDPYMRGRMREGKSYARAFDIGRVLAGGAVGQVVEARSHLFQGGEYVYNMKGWREYFVAPAAKVTQIYPNIAPIQSYLGALGMPGFSAYVGLLDIGQRTRRAARARCRS